MPGKTHDKQTSHSSTSWLHSLRLANIVVLLVPAIIVSALFIPADSISVYEGETLTQISAILITCAIAALIGWRILPAINQPMNTSLFWIGTIGLAFSTWVATHAADGRAALNGAWHVFSLLLFALLLRQLARNQSVSRALCHLLVACAVFQATYAMHQYFVSMPEARAMYLKDPEAELSRAGINAPPGSELRTQYESRLLGSSEPTGTFALTNSLAVPLTGALLVLIIVLLQHTVAGRPSVQNSVAERPSVQSTKNNPEPNPKKPSSQSTALILTLVCCLLIGTAWLLTKSRTAYLALIVIGLPSIYFVMPRTDAAQSKRQLRWLAAGAGLIALISLVGLVGLLASDKLVISEAPKSIAFRLEYWQAATRMILDRPLTGVGLGNFQSYYPSYKVPAASEIIADPHNWLFDIAACCSLPVALVAVVALMRALMIDPRSKAQRSETKGVSAEILRISPETMFWAGAGIGFVLTVLRQMMIGETPDMEAVLLGLITVGVSLWALRQLPTDIEIWKSAAMAAVVVMLVCLLATGSWQASGIALIWCGWLAVARPDENSTQVLTPRLTGRLVQTGFCCGALALFYVSTGQPVMNSWSHEQLATNYFRFGNLERAQQAAAEAVRQDPYSTSARTMLVQLSFTAAQQAATSGNLSAYKQYVRELYTASQAMTEADKHSYLSWSLRGENSLGLAAAILPTDRDSAITNAESALSEYRHASTLYPSSVALLAQTAVVAGWLAKNHPDQTLIEKYQSASQDFAQQAIAMSQGTPHSNRQLAAQQVWLPGPLAAAFPDQAVVRPVPGSPWAKAEPLCNLLRKHP